MIVLDLPLPPSVNRIWRKNHRAKGGVYRSPQYTAWLKGAWAATVQQRPGKIKGPYWMIVHAGRPDKRKRDIDNLVKPINDFLCSQQIIEDDSLATDVWLSWHEAIEPGRVEVVLGSDGEMPAQAARRAA